MLPSDLRSSLEQDAGYDYMLDPDHAPSHPGDPDASPANEVAGPSPGGSGRMTQGFAFQFVRLLLLRCLMAAAELLIQPPRQTSMLTSARSDRFR